MTKEDVLFDLKYILFGNIPENIVNTAEEENFDLIIMGHKGLSGIICMILGSVAEEVSRFATCPVLKIR